MNLNAVPVFEHAVEHAVYTVYYVDVQYVPLRPR